MMHIGWSPLALLGMNSPWRGGGIPFIGDSFVQQFALVAFGLAAVLGFRQAVVDFSGDAQHFLLHLPVSRQQTLSDEAAGGPGPLPCCAA